MIVFKTKIKSLEPTSIYDTSNNNISVSFRMSLIEDNIKPQKISMSETTAYCETGMNMEQWLKEIERCSLNNFESQHFQAIVAKGEEAVPFILDKLKQGPSPIVHALELIYPHDIPYSGYVSLSQSRRIWLRILKKRNFN